MSSWKKTSSRGVVEGEPSARMTFGERFHAAGGPNKGPSMRAATMLVLSVLAVFAGCGGKPKKKELPAAQGATGTCERAADKYSACIREKLGPDAARIVESKRDVASCAADPKTVSMYETCLPEADCDAFMKCITDYAK